MYNDFQLVGILESYANNTENKVILKIKVRKEFINSKGEIEYDNLTVLYNCSSPEALEVLKAAIGKKILLKGHLKVKYGFIGMATLVADRFTVLDWAY